MENKILKLTSELYDQMIKNKDINFDLKEFGLKEKEIKAFLKEQKILLLEFFEYKLNINQNFSTQKYLKFYQNLDIPYITIDRYIKLLKKSLLKEILKFDTSKEELLNIEYIFSNMLNIVANIYLKKEVNKNRYTKESKFYEFPLYKLHKDWIKKIFNAIAKENFKSYPHESTKECSFTKMMKYPETLMVCMNAVLCNQLDLLHKMIHNNSEALYRLIAAKEYTQAIFVFKELNENSQKFFSILKDLYHITYTDLENSFFKLIKMLEYEDKSIIVSMIDIQNLKQLNAQYGEKKVDEILETIESFLKEKFRNNLEESLVVRAISPNFYLLSLNKETKKFEIDIKNLLQELNSSIKNNFPNHNIIVNIAYLEFDENIKYQKDELIRILSFLKEKSKQKSGFYFAYSQKEKEELQKWLKEHYYNIQFIKKIE